MKPDFCLLLNAVVRQLEDEMSIYICDFYMKSIKYLNINQCTNFHALDLCEFNRHSVKIINSLFLTSHFVKKMAKYILKTRETE